MLWGRAVEGIVEMMGFKAGVALGAIVAALGTGAQAEENTVLKPIVVEGQAGKANATIGTQNAPYAGGMVTRGARLGSLGNRSFMDTPFNTSGYTAKTIEDKGASTVSDVMEEDASVRNTHPAGGIVDSFYIRGFPIGDGNFGEVAFDGVFGVAPNYRVFTDYAESVEVLKGPTSFLYGISPNGGVGGTINIVPKRALDQDLTRVTTTYESDLQGGTHVDISRRYGSERQFGVRLNGSVQGGNGNIDDLTHLSSVGAVALDYQGENLRATLDVINQYEHYDAPQRPFFPTAGIALPRAPDNRLNVQEPWEWSRTREFSTLGRVEYDLSDNLTVFGAAGGGQSNVERLFGTPTITSSTGNVSILPQHYVFDVERRTAEIGARGTFDTGIIEHSVTLQANVMRQTLSRGFNSGTTQRTNLYNPADRIEQFVAKPSNVPKATESKFYGLSLSDTMSMWDERAQLTLGARFQHIDSENYSAANGSVTSSSDASATTPMVGVVVKPWDNVSLYANYAEGLSIGETAPTNAINAGETLSPYKSKQYEVGTKVDLGQVALTASLFQIEKPFGMLETRGNTLVFARGGEQRNRGLELSAFGELTDTVRLLTGITFMQGELTRTNNVATQGNDPIGVPKVLVNMGAEWDTPFLTGLTLTGNVIHTGKQYADTANIQKLPAWTRLDLGARYKTTIKERPVTFRAEVENVFNKNYWSGVASFGTLSQGAPLTVKLSMSTDF